MKVSKNIIKEAHQVLEEHIPLPAQLPSFPLFYVAESDDDTISVHTSIAQNGVSFVIGGLKNRNT